MICSLQYTLDLSLTPMSFRTPRGKSFPASSPDPEGTVWRASCVRETQAQVTFDAGAFERLFRKPPSSNAAAPVYEAGSDGPRAARGAGDRRASLVVQDGAQLVLFEQLDAARGEQSADADGDAVVRDGHSSRDEGGLSRTHSKRRGHSLVRSPVRSLLLL